MNKTDIAELAQGIEGLVTLPDVLIRINQLGENPESTATDNLAMAIGG
jgi:hypothetical protein